MRAKLALSVRSFLISTVKITTFLSQLNKINPLLNSIIHMTKCRLKFWKDFVHFHSCWCLALTHKIMKLFPFFNNNAEIFCRVFWVLSIRSLKISQNHTTEHISEFLFFADTLSLHSVRPTSHCERCCLYFSVIGSDSQ